MRKPDYIIGNPPYIVPQAGFLGKLLKNRMVVREIHCNNTDG